LIKLNDIGKQKSPGHGREDEKDVSNSSVNGDYSPNSKTNGNNINSGQNEHKTFQNGKELLKFDEFLNMIKDSCTDLNQAENYLVLAFSMFDR
jgi:hypothetical protein